jgi:hypothetical protein
MPSNPLLPPRSPSPLHDARSRPRISDPSLHASLLRPRGGRQDFHAIVESTYTCVQGVEMEEKREHSVVRVPAILDVSWGNVDWWVMCDMPAIPKQVVDEWFTEDNWEVEDPLWRAALDDCIYMLP